MSALQKIHKKIKNNGLGWVFSAHDFVKFGSRGNVDICLYRLAKQGLIRQLGYGLYDYPRKSTFLGDLSPDIKDIMGAYAKKMGQVFVLDPLHAANALGFTTQIPANLTYLTNGKSHTLTVLGLTIHLTHASPKMLVGAMTPVGLITQALRYFGPKGAPDKVIQHIGSHISAKDRDLLVRLKTKMMRNLIPQIDRIEEIGTFH